MSTTPPRVVDYRLPVAIQVPDFKGDCLGMPTDWWFPPPRQNREVLKTMHQAITICNGCHAKQQCLDFALSSTSIHGIWGGLTSKKRINLLRARRRTTLKSK